MEDSQLNEDKDESDSSPISLKKEMEINLFEKHYILGDFIGKGGFGIVHKAINRETQIEYAVKVFKLAQ